LSEIERLGRWQLEPHFLKERYWMDCVKELRKWIELFLVNLGVDQLLAFRFAKVFGCFIEYDNSYRFRFEDIVSAINLPFLLANPRREIKRLGEIYASRERPHRPLEERNMATKKIMMLVNLLSFLMWLPSIKRAFVSATKEVNLLKMSLDKADTYHTLMINDYNYQGKSFDERCWVYRTLHPEDPPFATIGGSPAPDTSDTMPLPQTE